MSSAYKCDKCGKLFEEMVGIPDYVLSEKPYQAVAIRFEFPTGPSNTHFCQDCVVSILKSIAAFIEHGKKEHKPGRKHAI